MADQGIATAMSALAVRDALPPPPPRPNFPLPLELRDQIYGYLLGNKYTRVKRTYKSDSNLAISEHGLTAYHFHTNILAVNHAIHDEAEKLLYERNIFVVASYQCAQISSAMRTLKYVPVVSTNHVAKMKHHSLRIHYKATNSSTPQSEGIDSTLFVVSHLEAFCKMLKGHLSTAPPRSVLVDVTPGDLRPCIRGIPATVSKPPRVICEVRNTRHRAVDRVFQTNLLSPLADVVSDALVISFRGDICNIEETVRLQKAMTPSWVTYDAQCWAKHEGRASSQDIALDALQHDETELAKKLYAELLEALKANLTNFVDEMASNPLAKRGIAAMLLQETQLCISLGWLWLKRHCIDRIELVVSKIKLFLFEVRLEMRKIFDCFPLELKAYASHFVVLIDLYVFQKGQKTVGEVIDHLASFGDEFPHIAHDRAIIAKTTERTTALTKDHLSFEQCSVTVLATPQFPLCRGSDILKKPKHYVGLLDRKMIGLLNNEARRKINEIQATYGLEQTDFSEY